MPRRIIEVKVIARTSVCQVIPLTATQFKVKLTRPAIEGKANEQLIALLAEYFHVSKSAIRIVSGANHSLKRIEIDA